jgi:hypothetical protein
MTRRFLAALLVSTLFPFYLSAQSLDADPSAQADLLAKVDGILQAVSRLSGLPIREEVTVDFKDRDFFQNYYRARLEKQYPPGRLAAVEKAYVLLGFLNPGDHLIDAYLRSFIGDVEGLYDPDTKTLYLAPGAPEEKQEMVLAHELTHALQDQSFSLNHYFGDPAAQTSDGEFAKDSLVEGQAVEVASEYSAEKDSRGLIGRSGETGLAALPSEGREGLDFGGLGKNAQGAVNFPYVYGSHFFKACVSQKGKSALGNFFKNPPFTARQIIHPEEYLSLKPPDGGGAAFDSMVFSNHWKIWQDSLGEYGLFLILRQGEDDSKAWKSVEGWRGDQVCLYEDSAARSFFLTGSVEMNDASSARAFFNAYGGAFLKTHANSKKIKFRPQTQWLRFGSDGERVYLSWSGKRVVWAQGVLPEEILSRLR